MKRIDCSRLPEQPTLGSLCRKISRRLRDRLSWWDQPLGVGSFIGQSGAALVSSQLVYVNPPPPMGTGWTGSFHDQINCVEADWADESERGEARVEILLGEG